MPLPNDLLKAQPALRDWSILTVYRGSIAHGTYLPNNDPKSIDDKDVMAIIVPPPIYFMGLDQFGSRGTVEWAHDEWDIVMYEIRKAMSLLAQGNPNILQILWLEPRFIIDRTDAGQMLLDHRADFIGKHVYKPFVGYARAQFEKMRRVQFQGRMGAKRKQLVIEFGYDTKNAAHLIRLLRMGIEFLATGELFVERPDASELVGIKHGEWTLGQIEREADRLFAQIENALIHSTLPERPDRDKISRLCWRMVELEHSRRSPWCFL